MNTGIHGTSKNTAAAAPVSVVRKLSMSRRAWDFAPCSPRRAASNSAENSLPETRWSSTTP